MGKSSQKLEDKIENMEWRKPGGAKRDTQKKKRGNMGPENIVDKVSFRTQKGKLWYKIKYDNVSIIPIYFRKIHRGLQLTELQCKNINCDYLSDIIYVSY